MTISKEVSNSTNVRELTFEEMSLGKRILSTNLGLQPQESVLIVTDEMKLEKEAAIWFETAKTITDKVTLIVIDGMTHSGEEPPPEVVDACLAADVVILHTTFSLTHTRAGKSVLETGGRCASLPGVDYEMMLRTLMVDYQPIYTLGETLKQMLEVGTSIRITSPAGTNLTARIRQAGIKNDGGFMKSGEKGNLPAGETFFAPLLGSTSGTWVVDGGLADTKNLDQPVIITIENGIAVSIDGGNAAKELKNKLASVGDAAFTVAEIGIGTNNSTNPFGHVIEAEKAYGTAHMALGNSSAIGGEINVPIHIDGVSLQVTISVDDLIVMRDGKALV